MSWAEIKKAVNSNLKLPLNKKIEYVGGMIPRGAVAKEVNYSATRTVDKTEELLNVSGSGGVTYIEVYAMSQTSMNNSAADNTGSIAVTIAVDDEEYTFKCSSYSGDGSNTYTTTTATIKINTDITLLACTDTISNNMELAANLSDKSPSLDVTLNYPFQFTNRLKITAAVKGKKENSTGQLSLKCTVNYLLG